jgi:hypothetical protein
MAPLFRGESSRGDSGAASAPDFSRMLYHSRWFGVPHATRRVEESGFLPRKRKLDLNK